MDIKRESKLKLFVTVSWRYGKGYISIVRNTVPLVDQSVAEVWIFNRVV